MPTATAANPGNGIHCEIVLSVTYWTDRLFSLTTTRDAGFRFRSGQFTMIGLEVDGRPLMRAYSMASAAYDDRLEFFSIKMPDGPMTSRPFSILCPACKFWSVTSRPGPS